VCENRVYEASKELFEGRNVREIAENVAERNDGALKRMEDDSQ
jgi:hypothetical protein